MLEVKDLNAYYGKSHILRGVNLKIENGEIDPSQWGYNDYQCKMVKRI